MKYCEICHKELPEDYKGNICEECQNDTKLTISSPIYSIMYIAVLFTYICLIVMCYLTPLQIDIWPLISLGLIAGCGLYAIIITIIYIAFKVKKNVSDEAIRRMIVACYFFVAIALLAIAAIAILYYQL